MTTSTSPDGADLDAHAVERPEPALLDENRQAGADLFAARAALAQLALKIVPIGKPQRLVEQAGVVAGIVDDMRAERVEAERVGHGALADQIAPADLDLVDADLRRDGVEQPFAHERGLEAAGRAVGAARRLVGETDMARRRDKPARDRGRAASPRQDRARSRHAYAYRRRCRGRTHRRCRGCALLRRWPH